MELQACKVSVERASRRQQSAWLCKLIPCLFQTTWKIMVQNSVPKLNNGTGSAFSYDVSGKWIGSHSKLIILCKWALNRPWAMFLSLSNQLWRKSDSQPTFNFCLLVPNSLAYVLSLFGEWFVNMCMWFEQVIWERNPQDSQCFRWIFQRTLIQIIQVDRVEMHHKAVMTAMTTS